MSKFRGPFSEGLLHRVRYQPCYKTKGTCLQLLKRRWFLTSHMLLFSIAFVSYRAPRFQLFTRHFAGWQRTSRVEIMRAKFYREFATTPHPSNINDSCCKHLLIALQTFLIAVRVIKWQRNFDGTRFSSNIAPSSILQWKIYLKAVRESWWPV